MSIMTQAQLYRAYMPFIRNGGLFFNCKTDRPTLGMYLTAKYTLLEGGEQFTFRGRVTWINPLGSQGGRPSGVGLQFPDGQPEHKERIEKILVGQLDSNQITATM